jgi:hypothetical protein
MNRDLASSISLEFRTLAPWFVLEKIREMERRTLVLGNPKDSSTKKEASSRLSRLVAGTPKERQVARQEYLAAPDPWFSSLPKPLKKAYLKSIPFKLQCEKELDSRLAIICGIHIDLLPLEEQAREYHAVFSEIGRLIVTLLAGRDAIGSDRNADAAEFRHALGALFPKGAPVPNYVAEGLGLPFLVGEVTAALHHETRFISRRMFSLRFEAGIPVLGTLTTSTPLQKRLLRYCLGIAMQEHDLYADKELHGDVRDAYFSRQHLIQKAGAGDPEAIVALLKVLKDTVGDITNKFLLFQSTAHELSDADFFDWIKESAAEWGTNRTLPQLKMLKGKLRRRADTKHASAAHDLVRHKSGLGADSNTADDRDKTEMERLDDRLNAELGGNDPEKDKEANVRRPAVKKQMTDVELAYEVTQRIGITPRKIEGKDALIVGDMSEILRHVIARRCGLQPKEVRGVGIETLRNWDRRGNVSATFRVSQRSLQRNKPSSRWFFMEQVPRLLAHWEMMGKKQKHEVRGRVKLKAAAKNLQCSVSTLKRMINHGNLPKPERDLHGTMLFSKPYLKAAKLLFQKK